MIKLKTSLLLLLGCAAIAVQAQSISNESVVSSGGYFSNNNSSLTWSVGEIATETIGSGYKLTQGFNQPTSTTSPVSSVNAFTININQFNISPNPAFDQVTVFSKEIADFEITVYNALGQAVLSNVKSTNHQYSFDVTSFSKGVHFLVIKTTDNQYIKSKLIIL
ncbi:MAG: T9SS type A sorting domain-containing protein [Bacteroidota bacterium]